MTSARALITGGGGQLASDLVGRLDSRADVYAPSRAQLDILDDNAVDAAFATFGPTLVLNCAAFHNVEVCEREEDRAFAVNARAVGRLARRCGDASAKLVHISTNYVFDGTAAGPYAEGDLPAPRSIYGISKLAGEHAAQSYARDALVVRTAGLYGLHGSASKGGNFVTRMIARAREQGSLSVVADQLLTPTFTVDLASAIIDAVTRGISGTLHLTNAGVTSWHGFTEAIMSLAGIDIEVDPTATTRSGGVADRPLNGALRSSVAAKAGLSPLRHWREALGDYLQLAGFVAANDSQTLAPNMAPPQLASNST